MRYSIEKIEESIAVCESDGGEILKVPLPSLPTDIKEGDIIVRTENGFAFDRNETQARRRKMAGLQRNIFGKK